MDGLVPGGPSASAAALLRPYLPPMLATLAQRPPPGGPGRWWYECKYDGFRALAAVTPEGVALLSRNGLDLSRRFPHLLAPLARLSRETLVLDGEIAVLDRAGVSRFERLQQGHEREAQYFLFDLLRRGDRELSARPLRERRGELEGLLAGAPPALRLVETLSVEGSEALEIAAGRGWEGLVGKRVDAGWRPGRSRAWIKLKLLQSEELVVVGFTPTSSGGPAIGALVLGIRSDGGLRYAGKVGTGFTAAQRSQLHAALQADRVAAPPVQGAPRLRGVQWVRPRFVAQVRFTEWTSEGVLRHPSFQGLRWDKGPEEVAREAPRPAAARRSPGRSGGEGSVIRGPRGGAGGERLPRFTHPDRVLFPRDGITKADLRRYYRAVAPCLLPVLRRRFLSFQHWNEGIDGPGWFHQNIDPKFEEPWMHVVEVPSPSGRRRIRRLLIEGREGLDWLAQHSVITLHVWSSHLPRLDEPDWVVFDLDPPEELPLAEGFPMALEAAQSLRKLLDRLRLPSLAKTSGKRGLHVMVPLLPGHRHRQAIDFALAVGRAMEEVLPWVTLERSRERRRGRLYVDCFQNGQGKTIVAPYSPRAVDGAPVSAPLVWKEVKAGLDPLRFNLRTMVERIEKRGDLFSFAQKRRSRLPSI